MARRGAVIAGRFELEAEIGSGGMGKVYRARDRQTGERAAVKLVRDKGQLDLGRFARECSAVARLAHPNIVRYIAHGEHPEPYLVMEWIEGTTLADHLDETGLDIAESVVVAGQLASALSAAHSVSVVHRDLKPANVMLRGDDLRRATVIDFGIARVAGVQGLTRTGTAVGTPGYMAPEQATGMHANDRSDVFSLGCVLYECLTAWRAFAGENALAVQAKVCAMDPDPVRQRCPEVPAELEELLAQMLAKEAEDRPTAADVGERLARLAARGLPGNPRRAGRDLLATSTDALPATGRIPQLSCIVWCSGAASEAIPGVLAAVSERSGELAHKVHVLEDGTLVFELVGSDPATAVRAARLALVLRDTVLGGFVVVTASTKGTGDAIDRGARTLATGAVAAIFAARGATPAAEIRVDRGIAARLDESFDVVPTDEGGILRR